MFPSEHTVLGIASFIIAQPLSESVVARIHVDESAAAIRQWPPKVIVSSVATHADDEARFNALNAFFEFFALRFDLPSINGAHLAWRKEAHCWHKARVAWFVAPS